MLTLLDCFWMFSEIQHFSSLTQNCLSFSFVNMILQETAPSIFKHPRLQGGGMAGGETTIPQTFLVIFHHQQLSTFHWQHISELGDKGRTLVYKITFPFKAFKALETRGMYIHWAQKEFGVSKFNFEIFQSRTKVHISSISAGYREIVFW